MFLVDDGLANTPLSYRRAGDLLYVGMAGTNLRGREVDTHLDPKRTARSSLRRSLGAVLHDGLGLVALSRADGDTTHYHFQPEGEGRLSDWMRRHLQLCWLVCASAKEADAEETLLIGTLNPALNIEKRPDCDERRLVERLRAACRREASDGTDRS